VLELKKSEGIGDKDCEGSAISLVPEAGAALNSAHSSSSAAAGAGVTIVGIDATGAIPTLREGAGLGVVPEPKRPPALPQSNAGAGAGAGAGLFILAKGIEVGIFSMVGSTEMTGDATVGKAGSTAGTGADTGSPNSVSPGMEPTLVVGGVCSGSGAAENRLAPTDMESRLMSTGAGAFACGGVAVAVIGIKAIGDIEARAGVVGMDGTAGALLGSACAPKEAKTSVVRGVGSLEGPSQEPHSSSELGPGAGAGGCTGF
jgi:hypothetical protein